MFGPNLRSDPPSAGSALSACSALICEQAPIRRFSPLLRADRLAASAHQHTRYKTLPTRPKRPISASFARAGRTLYRIHPHDPQQGELCTAPSPKPGTKLPQRPRSTAVPRKSSPSTPHTTTEPRKSSPSTPKNGVFRLFRACRANFFALTPTPGRAGRTYSRRGLDRTR